MDFPGLIDGNRVVLVASFLSQFLHWMHDHRHSISIFIAGFRQWMAENVQNGSNVANEIIHSNEFRFHFLNELHRAANASLLTVDPNLRIMDSTANYTDFVRGRNDMRHEFLNRCRSERRNLLYMELVNNQLPPFLQEYSHILHRHLSNMRGSIQQLGLTTHENYNYRVECMIEVEIYWTINHL